jgi:hypothetical protein
MRNWWSNKSQKFIETGSTHSIICEELIRVIPVVLKIYMKFPNWKSCTINRMYSKPTLTSSSIAGYKGQYSTYSNHVHYDTEQQICVLCTHTPMTRLFLSSCC